MSAISFTAPCELRVAIKRSQHPTRRRGLPIASTLGGGSHELRFLRECFDENELVAVLAITQSKRRTSMSQDSGDAWPMCEATNEDGEILACLA
jgi:hypothetical protein